MFVDDVMACKLTKGILETRIGYKFGKDITGGQKQRTIKKSDTGRKGP